MDVIDYDRALYYTHRSQWDNLLILMVRTDDDFLSKRLNIFCTPTILNETTASFKKSFILYYATLIMQRNIRSTTRSFWKNHCTSIFDTHTWTKKG